MIYARGGVVLQTTSRDEMLSWTQGGMCDSCMPLMLPTGPGNEITAAVGTYTNLVLFFSLYCFMCFHTLFFCFFFFFCLFIVTAIIITIVGWRWMMMNTFPILFYFVLNCVYSVLSRLATHPCWHETRLAVNTCGHHHRCNWAKYWIQYNTFFFFRLKFNWFIFTLFIIT